jgi:predicted transcriptional regulator
MLINCTTPKENQMRLSGFVKGMKEGTLLLQKTKNNSFITVDSMIVKGDAHFNFSERIESPELYFLSLKIQNIDREVGAIAFFAEPEDITIKTTLNNFLENAVITGSKNQKKYTQYKTLIKRYTEKNKNLTQLLIRAAEAKNMKAIDSIDTLQKRVLAGSYLATVNFALNNKEYEIAPFLALSEIYNANTKYLDTIYNTLTPKIKASTYGVALKEFIGQTKSQDSS